MMRRDEAEAEANAHICITSWLREEQSVLWDRAAGNFVSSAVPLTRWLCSVMYIYNVLNSYEETKLSKYVDNICVYIIHKIQLQRLNISFWTQLNSINKWWCVVGRWESGGIGVGDDTNLISLNGTKRSYSEFVQEAKAILIQINF